MGNESKIIATALALSAFAVAVVGGLWAGLDTVSILTRGIIAMIVCHVIGMGVGAVIEHIIVEHDAAYRAAHPVPPAPRGLSASEAAVVAVEPAGQGTEVARAA